MTQKKEEKKGGTFNVKSNGRPPKEAKLKRENHRVQLNCTKDEHDHIKKQAKRFKLSRSKFCLRVIMKKELPFIFQEDIADLNKQIRRIGVNLNQMSKSLNELKRGGLLSILKRKQLEDDIQSTIIEYREILDHLMKIRN